MRQKQGPSTNPIVTTDRFTPNHPTFMEHTYIGEPASDLPASAGTYNSDHDPPETAHLRPSRRPIGDFGVRL